MPVPGRKAFTTAEYRADAGESAEEKVLIRMRTRFMKQATVVGACAGYAAYCLLAASAGIGTSPDSVFYLSFSPIVPTGYPVFLKVFGENGAVIVQPLLYGAALTFLGLETLRHWASLPLALTVIAGGIAVPELRSLHASILTESLFMSCEVALLASTIRFVQRPGWSAAALSGVTAGLAATVRNAGYAFFPVLLVMALFHWRRLGRSRVAVIASIALPGLGFVAMERAIAHAVNGDRATSLLGRHMFAKAALIEAPRPVAPLDSARSIIEEHLEVEFARIRQTIATAPPSIRSLLTVYYETCLQGPCAREMREASIGALPEAEQNRILVNIALERIVHAPLNFARLTIRHYASLWMAYKQEHPDTTPILNEFLSTHHPLPYAALAFSWREPNQVLQFRSNERVRYLQPAVVLMAWLSGALAISALVYGFARRLPPPLLAVAALSALTAHAGVLFSATFAPGISRFTVSFWPAVMTAVVFAFWFLIREARQARDQEGLRRDQES
jgi:hypothetical protein